MRKPLPRQGFFFSNSKSYFDNHAFTNNPDTSILALPGEVIVRLRTLDESNISHYCTGLGSYSAASGAFAIDVNEAAIDAALSSIEPVLAPTSTTSGFIRWNCIQGTTPSGHLKYLPSTCRDS